jgi:hypothetical protein
VISCSGWTRSSRSRLRNTLHAKEGGQRKGGSECCTRNGWRRSARKTKKRSERGWRRWNVRRQRNVKLIGRGSERGHVVRRKQNQMLLGRGNIPGALSEAASCIPGILYFLRHIRCSSNMRLPCCTYQCRSLFNFTV